MYSKPFLAEHLSEARRESVVGALNSKPFFAEHLSEARRDGVVGALNSKPIGADTCNISITVSGGDYKCEKG